jgi:hypothetical protein
VKNGPPPFIKACIRLSDETLVFLLSTELSYSKLIEEAKSAFYRNCLSAENITSETPVLLTGPMNLQKLVFNDAELDDALDDFQEAFELQQAVNDAGAIEILQSPEECPPYDPLEDWVIVPRPTEGETPSDEVDIFEGFHLRTTHEGLFQNNGIIDMEISLW